MQVAIISGKGGTGKTTIASSFAYLASSKVIKVDCDVDASNLHLMFQAKDLSHDDFYGAKVAEIIMDKCVNCGECIKTCRFDAIKMFDGQTFLQPLKCEGCGACKLVCKENAISLHDELTGKTFITESTKGIISRAEMFPGAEGSGKLVSKVRLRAEAIGLKEKSNYIIDGSPGIGCAVMASITGCDHCVIVTEATQSGFEDFLRVHKLVEHFSINSYLVINKYDINLQITDKIQSYCLSQNINLLGKIPFDHSVLLSINQGKALVSYEDSLAGDSIKNIWAKLVKRIGVY